MNESGGEEVYRLGRRNRFYVFRGKAEHSDALDQFAFQFLVVEFAGDNFTERYDTARIDRQTQYQFTLQGWVTTQCAIVQGEYCTLVLVEDKLDFFTRA